MFYFYIPWKRQKISRFLQFSGGVEIKNNDMKWFNKFYKDLVTFVKLMTQN